MTRSISVEREIRLILPEATAVGVRLSHASRENKILGIPLSNTWITCPVLGDNLAKVRTIPHGSLCLERLVAESSGGTGWVCGVSGRRGCNVPPSLRRVRVVRAIARRWILRHESRPYGAQQARKLDNARNRDQGTPVGWINIQSEPTLNRSGNRGGKDRCQPPR